MSKQPKLKEIKIVEDFEKLESCLYYKFIKKKLETCFIQVLWHGESDNAKIAPSVLSVDEISILFSTVPVLILYTALAWIPNPGGSICVVRVLIKFWICFFSTVQSLDGKW